MDLASKLSNRNVIIISIGIAILGAVLAIFAGSIFDKVITEVDKDWDKALKFTEDNASEFPYAIKTRAGNLYASGEIKAASDLVKNDNLPSEYLAVSETIEEYREHTYTYSCRCKTVKNRTSCDTCRGSYWSWDYAGSETSKVEKISLLGQEMSSNMIPWDIGYDMVRMTNGDIYLDRGYNKRSYFSVVSPGITGSFGFTSNDDGFKYNPKLNGPSSGTWKVGKVIAEIVLVLAGLAGGIAFAYHNLEHYDEYI